MNVVLYRPQPHNKATHIFHLGAIVVSIVVISSVAIFYSLGYQLNLQARSIKQTGILTLGSERSSGPATVSINGKQVATKLPYRMAYAFPGSYRVTVQKPGYQEWNRTIEVEPNVVTSFNSIVLLRNPLVPIPVSLDQVNFGTDADTDVHGLEVHENELRVDGRFITRTSDDIASARWYPDNQHLIYQAGATLWLADLDGLYTQKLLTLPTAEPVTLVFKNNGRLLYYLSEGKAYMLALF